MGGRPKRVGSLLPTLAAFKLVDVPATHAKIEAALGAHGLQTLAPA